MRDAPTLVVVPTYNERETLVQIIPAIRAAAPDAFIQVVDDNSPDGTGAIADQLAAADPQIDVLHRPNKQGLGAAYLDAFRRALASPRGYARIVQMDSDFSHNPTDIPRLSQALDEGADMALGSRYVPGGGTQNWGLVRRLISRGGGIYARTVLGVGIQDLTAGFKAWKRETLSRLDLDAVTTRGYGFQIEMTYRTIAAGFRVVEVPITFVDRRVGQSKMSGLIVTEAMSMVWALRRKVPRRQD
ncbi:MAG TPA: polyprenol monophosphomannose synthase [Polyangia bacterium]|nr:polyprenol monophosphomannose synthase [Polyangia bacterium]